MIVDELRIIFDHVPGDLDVIVCSHGACHVDLVERTRAGRNGGPDNVWARLHGPGVGRSTLVLRGGSDLLRLGGTPGWEPAPDFTLRGAFRRRADLAARLDPDAPHELEPAPRLGPVPDRAPPVTGSDAGQ